MGANTPWNRVKLTRGLGTRAASNARRILLNAHVFNADETVQLGLIHKSVVPESLDDPVESELKSCLACAPGAITMTKELIRTVNEQTPEKNKSYTALMPADAWETDEAQAGISGFFNKQPPHWAE